MASTTISYPIDKYSFCEVPMSQPDAKPHWNHHLARDHIHLVLQHEGPLEQPSDPKFSYMTKLILKVIWRAETLESINISDVLNQKSGYIDFANMVCMIRSPSMALKFVNLRSHTLRRLQVRFCKQEDYQAVISSLERIGCPVQHHNTDNGQASQQQKGLRPQYERPDTATSMLSVGNQVQYSGPDTTISRINGTSPVEHRTPLFPQGIGLGAIAPQPHRQYMGVQQSITESPHQPGFLPAQPSCQLIPRHQDPMRFSVQPDIGSSPPPRPVKLASSHLHQSTIDISTPFQPQRRLSFAAQTEPYVSPTRSHHFNPHLSTQSPGNPFDTAYHNHLRRGSNGNISFPSHAQADTSVPVSRGTLTSAGTLFGQSSSQAPEPFSHEALLQASQASQAFDLSPLRASFEDESLPPRRSLPDFEKINKVHGDKPLPSSSGKISSMFKASKGSGSNTPSLKRKEPGEDEDIENTGTGNARKAGPAKRTKLNPVAPVVTATPVKRKPVARKATTTKPKGSQKPAASQKNVAATKPKKPAAKSKNPTLKLVVSAKPQPNTSTELSLSASVPSTPRASALQETPPSKLNLNPQPSPVATAPAAIPQAKPQTKTQAKQQPKTRAKQTKARPVSRGKAAMLKELDGDTDERMLSQMLNSETHLVMLEKLEGVWARAGFRARIQASAVLGDGANKTGDKAGEAVVGVIG
ncbi:hypothetical protein TWF192_010201 [Orbilia oligospora]|uniref:Uncharacterized protein n=1 Tax=Orbilia oligospora TaxID=2813651 RepID=A0A6G1LZN5_ORBOL|nr:hypothetical protein TWF679_002979 [Orbilia oligospora]KAF3224126.1 hypothetical protein TWF191_006242 [Orbilia oligospora]KAF3238924.1 hypothetical protein TWF192_010201 [Orbilia oligospora]